MVQSGGAEKRPGGDRGQPVRQLEAESRPERLDGRAWTRRTPWRRGAVCARWLDAARRTGRRWGDSATTSADLTPEERAAQAAVQQLQAVPEIITIKATVDSVSFNDARGERTFPVNGKKTTIDIAEAKVNVKTSWDKAALKQEFSTPKASLTQTWQLDESQHLVVKTKVESMTMVSREVKIVFDKQ